MLQTCRATKDGREGTVQVSHSQQQANSFTAQRIASGTVAAMGEGEGGGGRGKLHCLNLRRRRRWNAVYKSGEEEVAAGFQKKKHAYSAWVVGAGVMDRRETFAQPCQQNWHSMRRSWLTPRRWKIPRESCRAIPGGEITLATTRAINSHATTRHSPCAGHQTLKKRARNPFPPPIQTKRF